MFEGSDYAALSRIVFQEDYPGFNPQVKEYPNGDAALDLGKEYAHIYPPVLDKYLNTSVDVHRGVKRGVLSKAYQKALDIATSAAVELGFPPDWFPDYDTSCLRVLRYPPGSGSVKHTDFDLFTVNLFRSNEWVMTGKGCKYEVAGHSVHLGELAEEGIFASRGTALEHWVEPSTVWQYSIVFFAMPNPALVLPSGQTVGDWVTERKVRSRTVLASPEPLM